MGHTHQRYQLDLHVLYSAKQWQGKTLANMANLEQFAKVLPNQVHIIKQ